MLKVQDLRKSFDNKSPLFEPVNFTVNKGQVLQIVGPNGVGKTTLLKCLAGYLDLDEGYRSFQARPLAPMDTAFSPAHERAFFPKLTVTENLKFFQSFYSSQEPMEPWCEQLGLQDYLNTSYQKCSSGIRKRVAIARTLLKASPILLLDEPFANLDPQAKETLAEILFKNSFLGSRVILMTSNSPLSHSTISNYNLSPWVGP